MSGCNLALMRAIMWVLAATEPHHELLFSSTMTLFAMIKKGSLQRILVKPGVEESSVQQV